MSKHLSTIEILRSKITPIEFGSIKTTPKSIDREKLWKLAERVGKTMTDDSDKPSTSH